MSASVATAALPAVRSLLLDGASVTLLQRGGGGGRWQLDRGGRAIDVEVLDERQDRIRELSASAAGSAAAAPPLKAPMPGLVVQVAVREGDAVAAGAPVVIIEAMKMENELRAAAPATVARALVAPGDAVEKGQVLVEFGEAPAS